MVPAIPSWFMMLVYATVGFAVVAFFVKQQNTIFAMGEAVAYAEAAKVAAEAAKVAAVADKDVAEVAKDVAVAAKVAAEAEHNLRLDLEPDALKWRQVKTSLTPDKLLQFNNAWKLHKTQM